MTRRDFAAGFVIYRLNHRGERTYLVMKNAAGHWELPKGHPKSDETWIETALREVNEETGITDAKPIADFARQIQYVFRDGKLGLVRKTVCFAVGETTSIDIRLSREHTEFAFLNLVAAVNQLTHAGTKAVLRDADCFLASR